MIGSAKLPPPDLAVLEQAEPEYYLLPADTGLSRIHDTGGHHPSAWNELRCWGPHPNFRFDPHPDGSPMVHPSTFGVAYLALDVATAFAEVFQEKRIIAPTPSQTLTVFPTQIELRLLDLTDTWPGRVGAAHAINGSENKAATRAWARAFHLTYVDAHGLLYQSSMTGRRAIALFDNATQDGVFPRDPSYTRPLRDRAARGVLLAAAAEIGYVVA